MKTKYGTKMLRYKGENMSNTLKGVIILFAIIAVFGYYLLEQDKAKYQAEFSPHQGLQSALNTGRVELKSFQSWCESQGHQGEALADCVQKRKAKAQKLLELEKKTQKTAEEVQQSNTPASDKTADQ